MPNTRLMLLVLIIAGIFVLAGCGPALPLRSDMPLDGLTDAVTYTRTGPAGNPMEENKSLLRGMNDYSPMLEQETIFGRMSGVKTEDVLIDNVPVLGMLKVQRNYGFSNFYEVESAQFHGTDALGNDFCGVKVRTQFNRNITQRANPEFRDYDALWFYEVPCVEGENGNSGLDLSKTKFMSLSITEIWQARIYWGSFFVNHGHSVTVVGGVPAEWPVGWWLNGDVPGTDHDSLGTAQLLLDMVDSLADSDQPWLEFSPGRFEDTTVIFSAGDADQYANFDRILLNRQKQYVVFYRPDAETKWEWITAKPLYNMEWNDVGQIMAKSSDWGEDPFDNKLNERGLPKIVNDDVIAELEKVGCQNCPNASLEQVQFIDSDDDILYTITFRGYVGANDTLMIYGPGRPQKTELWEEAPELDPSQIPPRPIYYDEEGDVLAIESQPYKSDEDWAEFIREATIWNWLKDNQSSFTSDLFMQYRVDDATEWAPIPCPDGGICGYEAVEWNLTASYFFDGDVRKAWLITNLLGEVGVRTLGFSYASNRYEGSGLLFAQAQKVFNEEYYRGFSTPETLFMLDARAMQLPDHLAEAWEALHAGKEE